MNSSSLMSRLGVKVTAIALIALAITFGIFLLIYEVAVPEFLYGERFDEYWDKKGAMDYSYLLGHASEIFAAPPLAG